MENKQYSFSDFCNYFWCLKEQIEVLGIVEWLENHFSLDEFNVNELFIKNFIDEFKDKYDYASLEHESQFRPLKDALFSLNFLLTNSVILIQKNDDGDFSPIISDYGEKVAKNIIEINKFLSDIEIYIEKYQSDLDLEPTVSDLVYKLLYYDRKNDEELTIDMLEGYIRKDKDKAYNEIVEIFSKKLKSSIERL